MVRFGAFHAFEVQMPIAWSDIFELKVLYILINHVLQLILDRETIHRSSSQFTAKGDCGSAALGKHVKLSKRFANRTKNLAGLLCERGRGEGAIKAAWGPVSTHPAARGRGDRPNAPIDPPLYVIRQTKPTLHTIQTSIELVYNRPTRQNQLQTNRHLMKYDPDSGICKGPCTSTRLN